jgi:hypothetical protein
MTTASRLRSVNPVQLGLILGIVYAILSFILVLLFLIFSRTLGGSIDPYSPGWNAFGSMGFYSLVIFPIGYFIGGFVAGLIGAALFNLVAGWIGGLEVTFEAPAVQAAVL